MIDRSFMKRRAQQLSQTQSSVYNARIVPFYKSNSPMNSFCLSLVEDDEQLTYRLSNEGMGIIIGSLARSRLPGECLVVEDGSIRYAVDEDTAFLYKKLRTLADELAQKIRRPIIVHNIDLLNVHYGYLDSILEEPSILPEPSLRKYSRNNTFVGDGVPYSS